MSQHKYASNVVEKCLEYGDSAERELMIEEILGKSEESDNLLVSKSKRIYFILYSWNLHKNIHSAIFGWVIC